MLSCGLVSGLGFVQGDGGANQRLQGALVYLVAFVEIDGPARVPVKAGIEEARRILQRRSLGEGHFHHVLVGLAGADYSVVRPHRHPAPLPLLDDVGIGFLDQRAQPAERLVAPVAQLLDSRVNQPRRRVGLLRPALLHSRYSTLRPIGSVAPACVLIVATAFNSSAPIPAPDPQKTAASRM